MLRELRFLPTLWRTNLQSAMEYRVAFLTQVFGMMLNNAVYFAFWILFFERFQEVRGWALPEMMRLFGVVACAFGLGVFLFGNATNLATVIAEGRLDYYLALPRSVLPHLLASRSVASGLGDVSYGVISFALSGPLTGDSVLRFGLAVLLSMTVFVSFMVLVQSLVFWLGGASLLGRQALDAILIFAMYPVTLFDGSAKFLLFTVIPAAFVGAVPAAFVEAFSVEGLLKLVAAAGLLLVLAAWTFHRGLKRYESGSALQVQV